MKKVQLIVLAITLLFPTLAYGEEMLVIQPEMMVFVEPTTVVKVLPQKETKPAKSLKYYAGSYRKKWGTLVLQTLSRLNMLLAADGKGLLLDRSQNMVLRGSKKRCQIVWNKSPHKDLILEVRRDKTASLGYQIEF